MPTLDDPRKGTEYFEIAPDRPLFADDNLAAATSSSSDTPETDGIKAAYVLRARDYEEYFSKRRSEFPWVDLLLREGQTKRVVFDGNLYVTLWELYLIHGWQGVRWVLTAVDLLFDPTIQDVSLSGGVTGLRRTHPKSMDSNASLSGGVIYSAPTELGAFVNHSKSDELLWMAARSFVQFSSKVLALLIREELIRLEYGASSLMLERFIRAKDLITKAWDTEFAFKNILPDGAQYAAITLPSYAIGNPDTFKEIEEPLRDVIRKRNVYEQLQRQLNTVRDHLDQARAVADKAHMMTGEESSSDATEKNVATLRLEESALVIYLEQAQAELALAMSAPPFRFDPTIAGLGTLPGIQQAPDPVSLHPLALLIVDSLPDDFAKIEDSRHRAYLIGGYLGSAIDDLRKQVNIAFEGIEPGKSRIKDLLIAPEITKITPTSIDNYQLDLRVGPEQAIINIIMAAKEKDQRYVPLVSETILNELFDSGDAIFERDSLTYVVYYHYCVALRNAIEGRDKSDIDWQAFWAAYQKATALLSIVALPLTLVAPPIAAAMGGAVALLNLALIGHSIYSVRDYLETLDSARQLTLRQSDAISLEGIAKLRELNLSSQQYLMSLEKTVIQEVLLLAAGGKWKNIQNALTARGYYMDLEVLLGD